MKFPPLCFRLVVAAAGVVFLAAPAQSTAESGALDPGTALHFEAPVVVETYAFDPERVFGTQTQMVRRKATARQRAVAEANARAYIATKLRELQNAPSSKSGKANGSTAPAKSKIAPPSLQALKASLPRIIAVNTAKDERTTPGTKREMMLYDTQGGALVGSDVYDVKDPPAVGSIKRFDTYSAEYVGGAAMLSEIGQGPPK